MRFRGTLVVAVALAVASLSANAASAAEAPPDTASAPTVASSYSGPYIATFVERYHIHADGTVDVTIDFAYDFNGRPGHGPFLSYPIRVPYDEHNDRVYRISGFTATSPTGAPADVNRKAGRGWVEYRIGDPAIGNVSGVQRYHVEYTIDGLLDLTTTRDYDSSITEEDAEPLWDEFYVNAIGSRWSIPIENVTVIVEGDARAITVTPPGSDGAVDARCFVGREGSTTPCLGTWVSDGVGRFAQTSVTPGESMTVAIAFPAGSFDTEPIIRTNNDFLYAFSVNARTLAVFVVALGLSIAWVLWMRRRSRDERYVGVTPGLAPGPNDEAHVAEGGDDAPVAVQFEPPPGLLPGHLGTLLDKKVDVRDVTATIVDLAVRGYIRIEEGLGKDEYRFFKLKDADDSLSSYEQTLFRSLFGAYLGATDETSLRRLAATFAVNLRTVQSRLFEDVTARGWFREKASTARRRWVASAILVAAAGIGATIALAVTSSWGIAPLPLAIVGVIAALTPGPGPARTAEGSRVLAQTRGFMEFLSTADGDMLRFEEKRDIFSEYLPYAIAFGVADKWTDTFAELAKKGATLAKPSWLDGSSVSSWEDWAEFGRLLRRVSGLADTVIAHQPRLSNWSSDPGGAWGSGGSDTGSSFAGFLGAMVGGLGSGRSRGSGFSRRGGAGRGRFGGGGGSW